MHYIAGGNILGGVGAITCSLRQTNVLHKSVGGESILKHLRRWVRYLKYQTHETNSSGPMELVAAFADNWYLLEFMWISRSMSIQIYF